MQRAPDIPRRSDRTMCQVVGLGNPLRRDDGVGVAVIEALSASSLPAQVELVDGGEAGFALVGILENAERTVVVDCARMSLAPGAIAVFDASVLNDDGHEGLHDARAATALQVAIRLGLDIGEVTMVGIQPADTGWGWGMSGPVTDAVEEVCDLIEQLVR